MMMSKSGQLLIDVMNKMCGTTAYWISLWSITGVPRCPHDVSIFSTKGWKFALSAGHKKHEHPISGVSSVRKDQSIDWYMLGLIVTHIIGCMPFNSPWVMTKKGTDNITVPHGRTTAGGHEKGDGPLLSASDPNNNNIPQLWCSFCSVMSTTQHLDVSSEAHLTLVI